MDAFIRSGKMKGVSGNGEDVLRWKLSAEFKAEAVRLAEKLGMAMNTVATGLGIHDSVLMRWIRESHTGVAKSRGSDAPFGPGKSIYQ